jgi:antitoxin YefM
VLRIGFSEIAIDLTYDKAYVLSMKTLSAIEARSILYRLIDETSKTHKPITITGKRGNAVLLAEEDWNAINETLHLLSIPDMRESIRVGMNTNPKDCTSDLDW